MHFGEPTESMNFANLLKRDAEALLQCPSCHGNSLTANADGQLTCRGCQASYATDMQENVCSLMATTSNTALKGDIKSWWGDLYRQLYADNDQTLTPEILPKQIEDLEELFHLRQHMAAVEMPLDQLAGMTVLEIGPGGGGHSALFQYYGASVVAMDITPERVASTAHKLAMIKNGEGRAYQGDGENLPFRDNSFDIVYSNGVLHHSEDTDCCIDEVYRVLKPGGKAVIMLYSRHSVIFWLNILPRALLTGEIFRWPEAQWIGRLTEGRPKFGETLNPVTRVYSARQMRDLFGRFKIKSLRKSSFQFDNFGLPKLTQIRRALLTILGYKAHPGGILVYGSPYVPETRTELLFGPAIGFSWNIVAEK